MSVYKKLMDARIRLQGTKLKKSGKNKFAGYEYFELGDFLPAVQQIFADVGLCGIVSYSNDYAELRIIDVDAPDNAIALTSPMAEANLKGTHPIQNLGAVETYQRRYLWMTAMEIVEHDALDSSPPVEKKVFHRAMPQKEEIELPEAEKQELQELADLINELMQTDINEARKVYKESNLDEAQKIYLACLLPQKNNNLIKKKD